MAEDAFDTEEARRLITILRDEDLFRRVIRGWAIIGQLEAYGRG
jgi:hypothetical protein